MSAPTQPAAGRRASRRMDSPALRSARARAIAQDKWMRSLSSLPLRDVVTLATLGLCELAIREGIQPLEAVRKLRGIPEIWEPSGELTAAGRLWALSTGRSSRTVSTACSSRSKRSSDSSSESSTH